MEAKWSRSRTTTSFSDWLGPEATTESHARKALTLEQKVAQLDVSLTAKAWKISTVWRDKENFLSRDTNFWRAASHSEPRASWKLSKAITCSWRYSLQISLTLDKSLVQTKKYLVPTRQTIMQNLNSGALGKSQRRKRWPSSMNDVRQRFRWSNNRETRERRSHGNKWSKFRDSWTRRGRWRGNQVRFRLMILLIEKHNRQLSSRGSSLNRHELVDSAAHTHAEGSSGRKGTIKLNARATEPSSNGAASGAVSTATAT